MNDVFLQGSCLGLALCALVFNVMDAVKLSQLEHRVANLEYVFNINNQEK